MPSHYGSSMNKNKKKPAKMKKKGLTEKQKKLPVALQKAIMKSKKKK
tara:strand:- start:4717 stop:4857 length:141 start_codon:yes stop_codon:yes gene_type:complete